MDHNKHGTIATVNGTNSALLLYLIIFKMSKTVVNKAKRNRIVVNNSNISLNGV